MEAQRKKGGCALIQIQEVITKRQLKAFIRFPFTLYGEDPRWIPPLLIDEFSTLDKRKNPAFDHCTAKYWIAYRDGRIVGRIAAIVNYAYIEKWSKKNARFGWLDFVEDYGVAEALLGTAEAWAREMGMEGIQGPMGFCDLDKQGMLVEGFEERGTFTTLYNHPYYPRYLEDLGYRKDVDWIEYIGQIPPELPERILRVIQTVRQRFHLQVVEFKSRRELRDRAPAVFKLLNTAYVHLYSVTPLTQRQIEFFIQQYISFIHPSFVKLVLDARAEIAAFSIAMPSMARAMQQCKGRILPFGFVTLLRAMKRNDTVDLLLVAVRPDLQGKGVNTLLMEALLKTLIARGITTAEFNPQLEDNHKVWRQWDHFDTRQHKRRRCYCKAL